MRRFLFELAAICAIGALAETELTGRAERDNWGVPTSFGMKGSPTVVNPPVRAPENEIFSLNGEWEILADERSIPCGAKPFAQDGLPGDPGCCGTYLGSEADWQKFLKVGAYHSGGVGKMSPLFFRLVKRGRPLPFTSVPPEKLIAVGEGRDGYFCYLGGDRVTLYSFGLDVLSGHPEAVSLLDGMIDYCLSTGEKKEDS